jgi:hypothetical protein
MKPSEMVLIVILSVNSYLPTLLMGVNAASVGVVSTIAGLKGTSGVSDGNGTAARFNSPIGIATWSNGNMVVADRDNHAIRYITATGVVSTIAGLKGTSGVSDGNGTAARFNLPYGIAVLPNGNIVVTDRDNNAVRHITSRWSS